MAYPGTEGGRGLDAAPTTGLDAAPTTLGFLAPTVHGYYFGGLLTGVLEAATDADARVLAFQAYEAGLQSGSLVDDPYLAPCSWDHVDAFILAGKAVTSEYTAALRRSGKPVISISPSNPNLSYPTVVPDNRGGIVAIIRHLIEHGHRRIAYARRTPEVADDLVRLSAYVDEVTARGLACFDPVVVPWVTDNPTADEAVGQLLTMSDPPTAIVCCTDVTAISVVASLRKFGLLVPADMAVTGFDDIAEATTNRPPLTTVTQSFAVVGRTAAELALGAAHGQELAGGYHYAPVELTCRESCGCSTALHKPTVTLEAADGPAQRFTVELVGALAVGGDRSPEREAELSSIAEQVRSLVQRVADGVEGIDALIPAMARVVCDSGLHESSLVRVLTLLRTYGRTLATERDPTSVRLLRRMEDFVCDLGFAIVEVHLQSRQGGQMLFQARRVHYETTTRLLRREYAEDSLSLAWMAQTHVRAACFAIWNEVPGDYDNPADLRMAGSYDPSGRYRSTGEICNVRSFPPEPMLDLLTMRPNEVLYLLPVRFDGSDWGFLALIGPVEARDDESTLETFNHWSVMLTVALDKERAVQEIKVSEERYALAADAANDGLWDWNVPTGTTYYSARWKSLLGYAEDEISPVVKEWLDRIHPDDRSAVDESIARQFAGDATTLEIEHRMLASDETFRWMVTRARSVRDQHGEVIRMVGSMTDITTRKQLEDRLRRDALYDGLTGLPNRTLFIDRLNQAMENARRQDGYWFAVVFFDLNGFKQVNDTLGHHAGDQVLIKISRRLLSQLRERDTVARFGGDEFVVLLDEIRSVTGLISAVERILRRLSQPMTLEGHTATVTAAAGIAVSLTGYERVDDILRDADAAMYRAKAIGDLACVLFDESLTEAGDGRGDSADGGGSCDPGDAGDTGDTGDTGGTGGTAEDCCGGPDCDENADLD